MRGEPGFSAVAVHSLVACSLIFVGCGAAPDPSGGGESGSTPGGENATSAGSKTAGEAFAGSGTGSGEAIHRTIVTVNADGTKDVRELDITLEEHWRDIEIRTLIQQGKYTPAVVTDTSCAASSMWMFSQPNLTGSEVCYFYRDNDGSLWARGSIDIEPYDRCIAGYGCTPVWVGSPLRSFWAGSQAARLLIPSIFSRDIAPWERQDSLTALSANPTYLVLSAYAYWYDPGYP
jgi:hypothetical protein